MYLKDVIKDMFDELEMQSDSGKNSKCLLFADSGTNAAEILTRKLIPFFSSKFQPVK